MSDSTMRKCSKHVLIEQILLACGHYECKLCISTMSGEFKCCCSCFICGRNKKFEEFFCVFKESMKSLYDRVDAQIGYLNEEIDIRIESIKDELDRLGDELKAKLGGTNRHQLDVFARNMEMSCSQLLIEQKQEEFSKLIDEMNRYSIGLTFEISSSHFDSDSIGTIKQNLKTTEDRIVRLNNCFASGILDDTINLTTRVTDVSILSEDYFVTANYDQSCLALYNRKFHLVKTLSKLNDKEIHPICVAVANTGHIAVTDYTLHKVYILDHNNLTHYRTLGSDCRGVENYQFQFPFGVAYDQHGCLHVCDKVNRRIQVFDVNYEHKKTHKLDYEPYYIKILNDTTCVTTYSSLYFYDTASFSLLFHYTGHYGSMCVVLQTYFLEYDFEKRKIFYFNKNGLLVEEVVSNELFREHASMMTTNSWQSLAYFNDKLLIASENMKNIFVV